MWVVFLHVFWLCVSFLHPPRTAFCPLFALNVMFVFVSDTSPSIYVCASLPLCLLLSSSVFSSRRCLHNVPSSSLCDFAERGPGSGCHPLPPSQHCPGTLDQRHPAAHRLPALPHQPAPHLHRPAVWGAGTRLRQHWALLPGVQRADGPLQRIWVCWIHEEGLCITGPFWAAGPTSGMLEWLLKWSCFEDLMLLPHLSIRQKYVYQGAPVSFMPFWWVQKMHFSLSGQTWAKLQLIWL